MKVVAEVDTKFDAEIVKAEELILKVVVVESEIWYFGIVTIAQLIIHASLLYWIGLLSKSGMPVSSILHL